MEGLCGPVVAAVPERSGSPPKKKPRNGAAAGGGAAEICKLWNANAGKCAGKKVCTFGRRHACSKCGSPGHRDVNCKK